jgi:hypothetical protein
MYAYFNRKYMRQIVAVNIEIRKPKNNRVAKANITQKRFQAMEPTKINMIA